MISRSGSTVAQRKEWLERCGGGPVVLLHWEGMWIDPDAGGPRIPRSFKTRCSQGSFLSGEH